MLRETTQKRKAKAPAINPYSGFRKNTERLRGIVADAHALGVNRIHLWKVLTGRRTSATLLRRYRQLKATNS